MSSKLVQKYIEEIILMGIREDGRELLELRQADLVFNQTQDGVEVALGKTKVFAKVSSRITEPSLSKPNEGSIKFSVNLRIAQESGQAFENQKSIDLSNEIAKYLERNIKGSK
jgi:exosome complex RNA-binding protein Rrp42 (RNase PH superfamily)